MLKTKVFIFSVLFIWVAEAYAEKDSSQGARGKSSKARKDSDGNRLRTMELFLPGMKTKKKVSIEVIDGIAHTQGDIILGPVNKLKKWYGKPRGMRSPNAFQDTSQKKPFKKLKANARMAAVKDRDYLWAYGKIPYTFAPNLVKRCKKKKRKCEKIRRAIKMLNESTNLQVVPRSGEDHYVRFYHKKDGCRSWIGQTWMNEQDIVVGNGCPIGGIAHEILHAAGFDHTHNRPDRDEHITVIWDNIKLLKRHNYIKADWSTVAVGPYRTESIMHYGSLSKFAIDRKKPVMTLDDGTTFKARRPNPEKGGKMSKYDVAAINQVYPVDEPAQTSSVFTVCLKYKNGKLAIPGRNLKNIKARGTRCDKKSQLEFEDINGGQLESGDIIHVRSAYNRYLASPKSKKAVVGYAMLRSKHTRFKVKKVGGSRGPVIRSSDRVHLMNHYKRYLVGKKKSGLIVAKSSSKKKNRNFTITIKKSQINKTFAEEPSGKRTAGHWGSWGRWGQCPSGYFATGYRQRIEKDQGNAGDDSALNSIRILCRSKKSWKKRKEIKSSEGWLGRWSRWKECPKGHFLKSYSLKVEPKKGWGDDTAANAVKFKCSDGSTIKAGKGQKWGKWTRGQRCKNGFIGSFRTRVEAPQGINGDDSALNGLEIGCRLSKAPAKPSKDTVKPKGKRVLGFWGKWAKKFATCPKGSYASAFRVRLEKEMGKRDDTALNSIQLKCRSRKGKDKGVVKSAEGPRGKWSRWSKCPKGHYLTSFRMRVEPKQGKGDDTAANDVQFKCSNGKLLKSNRKGKKGTWRDGQSCGRKGYINGYRTRIHARKRKGDNTGLNGLEIKCGRRP